MSTPRSEFSALARYADIVDDYDAFIAACHRPLPRAVWATHSAPPDIEERLRAHEANARPIPWLPKAWRLPHTARPGLWPEFSLGWIHTQEEATLWPARVLGAQPGERILDLCAAPGNKTLRIAADMKQTGTIVANERSWSRMSSLRNNIDRVGTRNVVTVCSDGLRFDDDDGSYDRVLVDVPCSCEGTVRKKGRMRFTSVADRRMMSGMQVALLRCALRHVRIGGVVVYATCTYAPEENEHVLDRAAGNAIIEKIEAPEGVVTQPGVVVFGDRVCRPDVQNAARIWPHHTDTGGFFVARIRRVC